jgi:hypothetical protein
MPVAGEIVDPFVSASVWHVVQIQDIVSPGYCTLSGFKRSFGWEIKKGKGAKGSTVTLNEYPPSEGTITFKLWTPEHLLQWREFRDIWNYDPTKKPIKAVDIFHPVLADLGISQVVCKTIGMLDYKGKGLYEVTIELIEYNPPPKKPAVSTPASSEPREHPIYQNPNGEKSSESVLDQLKKIAGNPFG